MEDNYEYEKKTILIVDDEQKIVDLLVHNLTREGYNTIEANDGQTAINLALEKRPDLILLDVMLPRIDGLTVCKKIKNAYNVPILMVSAKDDELDKIVGLELGADDYITKPFGVREVVARVKANLRKVFPAYVLVKMIVTEETWYIVRNTRGVTGFVGSGTDPIPLTDEEIRAMGFDESTINVDYEVNDSVKILQGAFKDYIGNVQSIDKEKHRAKVLISMFGRETPVDVDFAHIERVD